MNRVRLCDASIQAQRGAQQLIAEKRFPPDITFKDLLDHAMYDTSADELTFTLKSVALSFKLTSPKGRRMRWCFERDIINKSRGFGVWYKRGCIGTEYGDTRRNEYLCFSVLVLFIQYNLNFSWKGKVDE